MSDSRGRIARIAILASAGVLAGCQTEPEQMSASRLTAAPAVAMTPMDGEWAATDGVFRASFAGGRFTSRFVKTNEILAQGGYRVNGRDVRMEWISVATQQQRSADCTILDPASVRCTQTGGGGFDLRRA